VLGALVGVNRTRVLWALRALVPLGALVLEGPEAALGAVVLQEVGLRGVPHLTDAAHARTALRLFVLAYAVRAAVIFPTHYVARLSDGNGALYLDDYTNDLVAEWLVRIARGDGLSIFPGHQHLLEGLYPYLVAGLFAIFGHAPLLPKLLNGILAAWTAVLVFDVARRAFRPSTGVLAGVGAAVLPTLIVWSVVTIKESLVLLLALLGLWVLQRLTERDTSAPTAIVVLVGIMAALLDLRASAALILVVLLAVVLFARQQLRTRPWQLAAAGGAVVILIGGGLFMARGRASNRPPAGVVEDIVLQIRHRRAQEAAGARSQIRPELDVFSATGSQLPLAEAASDAAPFTFSGDVLDPLGYALLAPAPWQARTTEERAASAEMLIWYALLAAAALTPRAGPRQPLFVLCLVMYGLANWAVLAVSEGNLGNLLRHRLMLAPVLLVLGAAGLDWLRLRYAPTVVPARLWRKPLEARS
jgi:hypothetical protein